MKYYKYITEDEAKMASQDIYDLYAWQPPEERNTKYSYTWCTNGTDWVPVSYTHLTLPTTDCV